MRIKFYELVFVFHEVKDVAAATDEKDLHDGVIEGYPFVKEVEVSRHEY
jgi:hypothetical protein